MAKETAGGAFCRKCGEPSFRKGAGICKSCMHELIKEGFDKHKEWLMTEKLIEEEERSKKFFTEGKKPAP